MYLGIRRPTWGAVASWFISLIRMHEHAGSSPFFVLSRQCLKMRVLDVDVELRWAESSV